MKFSILAGYKAELFFSVIEHQTQFIKQTVFFFYFSKTILPNVIYFTKNNLTLIWVIFYKPWDLALP